MMKSKRNKKAERLDMSIIGRATEVRAIDTLNSSNSSSWRMPDQAPGHMPPHNRQYTTTNNTAKRL